MWHLHSAARSRVMTVHYRSKFCSTAHPLPVDHRLTMRNTISHLSHCARFPLTVQDMEMVPRGLITAISTRAALQLKYYSTHDTMTAPHTHRGCEAVRGNCSSAALSQRKIEAESHPAGKDFGVPSLMTTGCGCQAWSHWLSGRGPLGVD